ncbi:hypothetical protein RCL_jg14373.t1 [Rhizophagus clarus]|uniref:Uncharacterized protein n=1 Tax=Rhizophagus clarus TaxID=94130 RepID=A0A8H3LPP0_9GLOM|nr:hypothetical protein RCL_jg14373.t1 [Rhizophagus clarus]
MYFIGQTEKAQRRARDASSLDINPHIILNKTGIAEWKKTSQQGFFTKTPELLSTIQQTKQKKLNEELVTLLTHHLTSSLVYLRFWYPEQPETPILGCVNNASSTPDLALAQEMNMDISLPASHQLTSAQPHTTAVNSPITTTPKGKGKKKKNKHITISEEDIDKDFRFPVDSEAESTQAFSFQLPPPPLHDVIKKVEETSAPLLDNNASKEKRLKVQDAEAAQVITGYQVPSGYQFV